MVVLLTHIVFRLRDPVQLRLINSLDMVRWRLEQLSSFQQLPFLLGAQGNVLQIFRCKSKAAVTTSLGHGVDKHFTARMFFNAFMDCALTVAHTQFDVRSTIIKFVKQIGQRRVIEFCCSTLPLKSPGFAFHNLQRHTHFMNSLISDFAFGHRPLVGRVIKCSTLLVNNLTITLNIQMDLRMCFTQTSVTSLALLPEQHFPQVMDQPTSNDDTICTADGKDDNLMTVEIISSDKLHLFQFLKILFFRRHGKAREQIHEEKFQHTRKLCLAVLKTLFIESGFIEESKKQRPA